ncbi:MAG: hypothetical protein V1809_05780 [Planctomycetota bacterium]
MDKHLEDAWLETLNALHVFEIASVCEGHPNTPPKLYGDRPEIILRLKPASLPVATAGWPAFTRFVGRVAPDLFPERTFVDVQLRRRLICLPELPETVDELIMRVRRLEKSLTPGFDDASRTWFALVVEAVRELDQAIWAWCGNSVNILVRERREEVTKVQGASPWPF